jgi:imidazolonepropionase-like amidohydrolase
MSAAGIAPRQILESMTAAPARLWGWDDLGAIEVGRAARLLVLDRDPLEDVTALTAPAEVIP